MSDAPRNPHDAQRSAEAERIDDLLADRALFGLDEAESAELERLLAASGRADDAGYDLLAASTAIASVQAEPLPDTLRDALLDDAKDFVLKPIAPGNPVVSPLEQPASGGRWPAYTMLAVAAGLLVSIALGPLLRSSDPGAFAARNALLSSADDVVQIAWAPQEDPALDETEGEAWGDVVWSDARQEGYMRFRGLAANDPTVEQYQLWVFDAERDDKYPVDGGVFDIPAGTGDEAIVPIRATLPVSKAVLFAITVEKPGGVVVSDRSRLPLLAQR